MITSARRMTENTLTAKLRDYRVILASGSPRRHQFFRDLGIPFEIRSRPVKEEYPPGLRSSEIPVYLAELKAAAFTNAVASDELLITSDTIVWHRDNCLGKPKDAAEATRMLQQLSGDTHHVISAACFTTSRQQQTIHCQTEVTFRELTAGEIKYYVSHYSPLDKAGGYGIQEWIGLIGITGIKGSYFNVMGLPTHLVYQTLMDMAL